MRKFLMIGLGGSGGKTLGFLMDELRFSLGSDWQSDELPRCWQFVHIDVPTQADSMGRALASPVRDQGGTYVGLADGNASYAQIDSVVFNRLKSSVPPSQTHLARWRPDANAAAAVDVKGGAGASRAIGRVVTLSQSGKIISELRKVILELNSSQSKFDLDALNGQVGSSVSLDGNLPPIVIIVSSMAGGSGASMVLDTADLLRGLTSQAGFDGDYSSAFLYTAEVFGNLTTNSGAGTLATISELQAAMLHRMPWTDEEWNVLGTTMPKPATPGRGPHAIFPVGSKSHGVPFGNTAEDVYRGFAKMLAPMFLSESLQVKFDNYVKVNGPNDARSNPDNSRITRRIELGTLLDVDYAHFMGWGSATLTTGRRRYLEYVSQRLARESARILVEGHGVDASVESNPIQKKRQIAENYLPGLMRGLPVGSDPAGNVSALGLLDAAFSATASQQLIDPFKNQLSGAFVASGAAGGAATAQLLSVRVRGMDEAMQDAKQQALQSLQGWAGDLQTSLENEYLHIASVKGLEIANLVLAEAGRKLVNAATRELSTMLAVPSEPPMSVANRELAGINSLGKQAVAPNSRPALAFLGNLSKSMSGQLRREVAQSLQAIVPDFVTNCLQVLEARSAELLETLMKELSMPPMSYTTAAYREAPITDWPKNDTVPGHFEPAVNEVMLDSVQSFTDHFWSHLGMTVENVQTGTPQLVEAAAQEIIVGASRERDTSNRFKALQGWRVSYSPSHQFVGRRSQWMPRDLAIYSNQSTVSAASYVLDYLPEALLEKARKWVERPGGAFSDFASVGIREWTYPAGLEQSDPRAATQRATQATNRLLQAISFASPLVEIDELLLQQVHGSAAGGLKYEFSDIPFSGNEPIVAAIQSSWMGQATQAHNTAAVRDSLNPVADQTEIVIFSTFATPYGIPVFKSLTEPIRNQWQSAKNNGATAGFWDKRRARPLRNFVPMRQSSFQAFVTGWVVGRISGHIRIVDNPYRAGYSQVEVFSDTEKRWIKFPADPDLLGIDGLGMASGSPALDQAGWNIPAALLESFGLALANVSGMDLSPLDPYWTVVDLGLSLKHVGRQSASTPLQVFLDGGTQAHSSKSQLSALSGGTSKEERKEIALKYLKSVSDFADSRMEAPASTIQELETFPRSFEIAKELRMAAEQALDELEFLSGDQAQTLGTAISPNVAEPEA
jgi:hypothetical protein